MNILTVDVPLGLFVGLLFIASGVAYWWGRTRGMVVERQHAREVRERLRRARKTDDRKHVAANPDLPESRISRGDFRSGYWDV